MLLPLIVFVVVTGGIVGAYYALTALPKLAAARQLDRRLQDVSMEAPPEGPERGADTVLMRAIQGPSPALDRLLARTSAGSRLGRLIDQAGVKTTPSGVVMISLVFGVATGLAVSLVTQTPIAPLIAVLAGGLAPIGFLMQRRSSRLKKFEEQFPEALDLLSRAIRAGHALQTALGMVADELPDPVGPEFRKTFDQQNFGLPIRDALNEMAARIAILDVRFFVTAVLIQRDTGGNLAEILDNLANVVRERFKIQRQVRVHTAHGRFTGYVLLALPAALALALSFINPDHIHTLVHERMGQTMLVGAVVMQSIGYFWIRQVIKIEV